MADEEAGVGFKPLGRKPVDPDDPKGTGRVGLDVVSNADLCVEKIRNHSLVKELEFGVFDLIGFADKFALGFQGDFIFVIADAALTIPDKEIISILYSVFQLIDLDQGEEVVIHLCRLNRGAQNSDQNQRWAKGQGAED